MIKRLEIFTILSLLISCSVLAQVKYNPNSGQPPSIKKVDTTQYIRFGIIPYQVLSRSFGIYVGMDLKKVSFEYRTTYTYATRFLTALIGPYDRFYTEGINNTLVIYPSGYRGKFGVMVVHRYWGYYNEWIYRERISLYSSYAFRERKTSVMNGIGLGVEYSKDLSIKKLDLAFFCNLQITRFVVNSEVYEGDLKGQSLNYPRTEHYNRFDVGIAVGFKIGLRKPLK